MGPESGVYKAKLQQKELEALAPFNQPSLEKQNPTIRAIAKNVSFTKVPEYPTGPRPYMPVRDKLNAPFFSTDYLEKAAPHIDPRGMAVRVAGITGGEKTLFGDLPETVAGLAGYEENAVKLIAKERGIDTIAARKAWMSMSNWLSDPKNLQAMKRLGALGEGGIMMQNNLYGMGVEQTVRYKAHDLKLGDWKSYVGQDIESVFNQQKGTKVLLGMYGGNPVTAGGTKNYVQNVHHMGVDETGVPLFEIEMREWHPLKTGTKVDVGGIKGLVAGVYQGDFARIRSGLNRWYKATGSGGYIPREATGISVLDYSHNKREMNQAMMDVAGDTMRRLQETGELQHIQPFLSELEQQGVSFSGGTLRQASAEVKSTTLQETTNIISRMFDHVSRRLISHEIRGDEFMQHYATHMGKFAKDRALPTGLLSQEGSYMQYAYRHAAPALAQAWDSTMINVPRETKVTYDMLQQLSIKGYYGAMEDIQSRVAYDGDPRINRQMEQYLKGDTDAITRTIKLEEGLNETGFLRAVNTPEGRAGTFFEEGFGRVVEGDKVTPGPYDTNYLMELPDGTKVPVLGHQAIGGKTNKYAASFSSSEHERALMRLMRAYKEGTPDASEVEKLKADYLSQIKTHIIGKESYLRADAVDETAGLGQFIQTRPSTLRYADTGEVNPFEIGIGPDMIRKIKDRELREALEKSVLAPGAEGPVGPDVYAFVTRHPVSDMPAVRVKVDPNLRGTNIIGIDEGMRGMLMADDDKDMIWAYFMRQNKQGHGEAARAVAGIEDRSQRNMLDWMKQLGNKDDPRQLEGATRLKNIIGEIAGAKRHTLDEALRARSTAGTIGAFSNTLTEMMIGVEDNTKLVNPEAKQKIARYLFDVVRQGPISASKLKNQPAPETDLAGNIIGPGRKAMSKERALGINASLTAAMERGGDKGFDQWMSALGELAGEGTPQRALLTSHRETLFKPYFEGISDREGIREAARAVTMSKASAGRARKLGFSDELMPYITAAARDVPEEAAGFTGQAGRFASRASAEALGTWNKIMAAGREAGQAVRSNKVGLVLGAGVAIAAAAGIATGNMDRRPLSGNAFTPEDRAGVSDQAPGGAWEGSRASRPRRNMIQSDPQMRTTLVAPIHETADLDVRIRATDRSRAHETARVMSQIATRGDSNVTINYSGQKRRSLRSRDKLRVAMEEE